ncbi:MAG: DUF1549 domain-containing protein [Armatimonadota bacterium]
MSRPVLLLFAAAATSALIGVAGAAPAKTAAKGEEHWAEQVRPLLQRRCFGCHSGAAAKGGLRLDTAQGWRVTGESGPAIVPGDPEASLLIRAVRYAGGAPAMPPGGKLPAEEIAILEEGVRRAPKGPPARGLRAGAGKRATSTEHWAFRPLRRPPLPAVKRPGWAVNEIDRFILAKLEAKGLSPSPPADRRTLIRRATFDLHGLPPTPEEVEAFLNDHRPGAYERLVDRLLASPHYGERWGRHWLDVVRYADTHGYDKDKKREHAWPYRDYVIRSFNQDKRYAQFLREQIAGDALDPADPDGRVATGFLAAGPWDFVGHEELREGTVEKEKTRSLDRDEIVSTTMGVFTSLTVGCARCHDHKFDPIPQRDYYRLQAVFSGIDRGVRPFATGEAAKRSARLRGELGAHRVRLLSFRTMAKSITSPELERKDAEIASLQERLQALKLPDGPPSPTNGYHSAIEKSADTQKWVQLDFGRSLPLELIRLIPARPTDFADTPGFGFPARFRVEVSDDPAFRNPTVVADHTAADFPNPGASPLDYRPRGLSGRYLRITATQLWTRTNDFVFALAEVEVLSGGRNAAAGAVVTALDSIEAGRWSAKHLVDGHDSRRRLPDRNDPRARQVLEQREALAVKLADAQAAREALHEALLPEVVKRDLPIARDEVARLERELAALPAEGKVYTILSREPRPIHLLARGDVERPLEPVTPGTVSCAGSLGAELHVPPGGGEAARRLALAEWLARPDNPLTWRSIVNRVWHYHFGRGIVDTPNDFGRNGGQPSHPELLDYLASVFTAPVTADAIATERQSDRETERQPDGETERGSDGENRNRRASSASRQAGGRKPPVPLSLRPSVAPSQGLGGSLKKLHRLIMVSSTYRQSSASRAAGERLDAENRLLWRMNRQRLDAESLRDAVLAVSGTLDLTPGGPGFELFRFKDDHSPIYDHTAPESVDDPRTFRRTVYRFVVRSVPNPFLESLDCADPNISTPVRSTTLTALQALSLLNDPFMVRQSEYFAQRVGTLAPEVGAQVEQAYRLALGRSPGPEERKLLAVYARKHGLANACRVLFNMNEFVFVD